MDDQTEAIGDLSSAIYNQKEVLDRIEALLANKNWSQRICHISASNAKGIQDGIKSELCKGDRIVNMTLAIDPVGNHHLIVLFEGTA